ncbi:MAG: hypothetical protein IT260_06810 [Saprospiraceae bacterium]|nr:hypothetical protein [Saprospiraceae bacterium]
MPETLSHQRPCWNPKPRFPKAARLRKSLFWFLLFGLGLACCPATARAQQPQAASSTTREVIPVPLDTTPFLFSLAPAPQRAYPADDTLPDFNFRMYNPARRQAVDYGNLGNVGSSARPLFFETKARRGFDPGFHAFDLYTLRPAELRFYRNTRSFTDLFFSQGRVQNDNMILAKFSRTFAGGLNFSLDYRNLNHLGAYRYQAAKHNALSVGVWYPISDRYEAFLIYTRNNSKQQENGGILTDTVFGGGQFSGPIDAEVWLSDQQALTKQADRVLHLTHHLNFTGGRDSSRSKRVLRASHTAEWRKRTFKFSDPGTTPGTGMRNDTLFYDNFLVDARGIRHVWNLRQLDNTFTINTFKAKRPGHPSDELALGLTHHLFILEQEPVPDSTFSNLFLTGSLSLTPSERFAFEARGDLGVLANFGEYQAKGSLKIGLGKAGEFRAALLSQRRPPSMLQYRLFLSKRPFWQNDFVKPVETSLSATYALPKAGLEITGSTQLVNNYLYFDQQGLPVQTGSPVQVAQLLIREDFRLGRVHFDNTVALQKSNRDDVLRLPTWFTRNSLYYAGPLFKKNMILSAGVDFRLNSEFMPDAYQPVTAQFYLQDSLNAKPYPWIDVFIAFKVQSFRFFFRYENLSTLWDDQSVFYQTARHPQPFGAVRFGIAWRFQDSNQPLKNNTPSGPSGEGTLGPPAGVGRSRSN